MIYRIILQGKIFFMLQYQYRTSQMQLVGLQIFLLNFWLKSRRRDILFCMSKQMFSDKISEDSLENEWESICVLSHCGRPARYLSTYFLLFISSQKVPSVFLSYYQRVTMRSESIRANTDGKDISRSLALTAERLPWIVPCQSHLGPDGCERLWRIVTVAARCIWETRVNILVAATAGTSRIWETRVNGPMAVTAGTWWKSDTHVNSSVAATVEPWCIWEIRVNNSVAGTTGTWCMWDSSLAATVGLWCIWVRFASSAVTLTADASWDVRIIPWCICCQCSLPLKNFLYLHSRYLIGLLSERIKSTTVWIDFIPENMIVAGGFRRASPIIRLFVMKSINKFKTILWRVKKHHLLFILQRIQFCKEFQASP